MLIHTSKIQIWLFLLLIPLPCEVVPRISDLWLNKQALCPARLAVIQMTIQCYLSLALLTLSMFCLLLLNTPRGRAFYLMCLCSAPPIPFLLPPEIPVPVPAGTWKILGQHCGEIGLTQSLREHFGSIWRKKKATKRGKKRKKKRKKKATHVHTHIYPLPR